MSNETLEQTFSVGEQPGLVLGNISGSVRVVPGEAGSIHVEAVKDTSKSTAKYTEISLSQDEDGTVRVTTEVATTAGNLFGLRGNPAKVDYTARVPENCALKISSVNGSVEVTGISGEIVLKSVNGKIAATDLAGNLMLESVSGKITGTRLHGPVTLKTVSGDAGLHASDVPMAQADTVSGDILVESPLGAGPYVFKSVSGDITLHVPEDASGIVHLSSVSGSIRVSGADETRTQGSRRKVIQFGEGGPEIRLKSVSGSLKVNGPAAIAVPVDPPPPKEASAPPENNLSVLEKLEKGEISVDEAVSAFKES